MSVIDRDEQISRLERSADWFDRHDRADDAADLRWQAERLRANAPPLSEIPARLRADAADIRNYQPNVRPPEHAALLERAARRIDSLERRVAELEGVSRTARSAIIALRPACRDINGDCWCIHSWDFERHGHSQACSLARSAVDREDGE